ncbi:helix-turn-helix domain-containing protein, partial [Pseudomonas sp.]
GLELALDNNTPEGAAGMTVEVVSGGLSEQVENFEKSLIAAELARSHSSVRSLAEALGIPRKTLHDKLRKHGLNFADGGASSHTDELD